MPSGEVITTCFAPASCGFSAPSRVRTPQSAPGMWPSRKSMLRARSTTTVPSPLSSSATRPVTSIIGTAASSSGTGEPFAAAGADRLQPALHHEHVAMAHLAQPGAGHAGAHAGVVHQHDARVADADPLVRRLHELSARRADAAGPMARAVLGGIAHIQHVERAVGIVLEAGEIDGADHAHA